MCGNCFVGSANGVEGHKAFLCMYVTPYSKRTGIALPDIEECSHIVYGSGKATDEQVC